MSTLARTIRTRIPLISFTSKGLWIFLLVSGLIFLIIFLPDVAGIHVRRNVNLAPEDAVEQEPQPHTASPLDAILNQVNEMGERKPGAPTVRELANQVLRTGAISWDTIKSEQVKAALTKARTECSEILGAISEEEPFSRFAMANYIQGLDLLINARDDRFNARQALEYVRYLDREVSRRFNEEDVDYQIYKKWDKVSLGDALKIAENRPYREEAAIPFNPEFLLNLVTVHRIPPPSRPGQINFTDRTQLQIEGSIVHRGIRKVSLFHNNKFLQDLDIPRPPKRGNSPYVYFSTIVEPIDGVFMFRIESDDEEVMIRRYNFYPRIIRLSDNKQANDFQAGRTRDRISRLDQYFLLNVTKPEEGPEGMVAF